MYEQSFQRRLLVLETLKQIPEDGVEPKWSLSLSVCIFCFSDIFDKEAKCLSIYSLTNGYSQSLKKNKTKKKLHTELLFYALGSSSPEKNEGIFSVFWVSGICMLFWFMLFFSGQNTRLGLSLPFQLDKVTGSETLSSIITSQHSSLLPTPLPPNAQYQ